MKFSLVVSCIALICFSVIAQSKCEAKHDSYNLFLGGGFTTLAGVNKEKVFFIDAYVVDSIAKSTCAPIVVFGKKSTKITMKKTANGKDYIARSNCNLKKLAFHFILGEKEFPRDFPELLIPNDTTPRDQRSCPYTIINNKRNISLRDNVEGESIVTGFILPSDIVLRK